jgi:hypothetical protein
MITLKEFFEITDYRISEGSEYGWLCYGADAYRLDAWNGDQDGHSHSIVFDTKTQEVYEVTSYDYRNNRAYRLMNQDYVAQHKEEALDRQVNEKEAWDDVNYIDLEVDDDWMQKALSIEAGEVDYDNRVQIPLTLADEQMFELMRLAHERDITLNQLVESVLREAIEQYESVHITNTDNPIDFPVIKSKKKKKGKQSVK